MTPEPKKFFILFVAWLHLTIEKEWKTTAFYRLGGLWCWDENCSIGEKIARICLKWLIFARESVAGPIDLATTSPASFASPAMSRCSGCIVVSARFCGACWCAGVRAHVNLNQLQTSNHVYPTFRQNISIGMAGDYHLVRALVA